MEELLELLHSIKPDVDFENETQLIDGGILDSFDIISLVAQLNEEYDIDITVNDLVPENFNSASAMYEMIERLQNEE